MTIVRPALIVPNLKRMRQPSGEISDSVTRSTGPTRWRQAAGILGHRRRERRDVCSAMSMV
jgi:hypothetical protein